AHYNRRSARSAHYINTDSYSTFPSLANEKPLTRDDDILIIVKKYVSRKNLFENLKLF
ncbi:5819_t:CDS:1, partial [Cetraspora pellucida]